MAQTDRSKLGMMTLGDVMNYLEKEMNTSISEAVAGVLPELPESDGTYTLQVVIDDGAATYSWESAGE